MWHWLDDRLDLARFKKEYLRKIFPVHHTFFLGEIALFSLIILVLTGAFLSFNYEGSSRLVEVAGAKVPAAYGSVLFIDQLPLGALIRSTHHWAAHLLVISAFLHLLRIFLTGSYKRPREVNWIVGLGLLTVSIVAAFTGYALPDDAFSVTATKIGSGIASAVPWFGEWLSEVLFGGSYPTTHSVPRLLVVHVLWLPLIIGLLVAVHLVVMIKQKHTQPRYAARVAPWRILGVPLWPQQTAMMGALFLICLGTLLLVAGTFIAHPVQAYGPPTVSTPEVKPDWYFLWIYGILQITPSSWRFTFLGGEFGPEFFGALLIPGLVGLTALLVPFFSPAATRLRYAENPWHHPARTGAAAALLIFFGVASLAGFHAELGLARWLLWALLVAGPVIAFAATWWILRRAQRPSVEGRENPPAAERPADGGEAA